MRINKILQKDYTLAEDFYQLKLPLNINYIIPDNDSVRLLSQLNQVAARRPVKVMWNVQRALSVFKTEGSQTVSDHVLTLVTCAYEWDGARIVVVAVEKE